VAACPLRWRTGNIIAHQFKADSTAAELISGHRKWLRLAITYCENGLQMENKSQEIFYYLGTQKYAKLCLKCTKIRLAAGLCPDPQGEL